MNETLTTSHSHSHENSLVVAKDEFNSGLYKIIIYEGDSNLAVRFLERSDLVDVANRLLAFVMEEVYRSGEIRN